MPPSMPRFLLKLFIVKVSHFPDILKSVAKNLPGSFRSSSMAVADWKASRHSATTHSRNSLIIALFDVSLCWRGGFDIY